MVKILPNGDIVPDDDPRAQSNSNTGNDYPQQPRQRQGFVNQGNYNQEGVAHMPQGSMFDGLNQRLLEAGIPRWNAGPYVVEPIVSVGFILAAILLGWRGILFAALLFFVVKYSSGGGGLQRWMGGGATGRGGGGGEPGDGGGGQGGGGDSRRWGGAGHRLGSS